METQTDSLKKEARVISLEDFANCYVQSSIECMRNKESMEHGSFEMAIHAEVSSRLGIPIEAVRGAANPFHWFFFCNTAESPLEYYPGGDPNDKRCYVRKHPRYNERARNDIASNLVKVNRTYLEARLRESLGDANLIFS
jgi:hypothetical protein